MAMMLATVKLAIPVLSTMLLPSKALYSPAVFDGNDAYHIKLATSHAVFDGNDALSLLQSLQCLMATTLATVKLSISSHCSV